MRRLNRTGRWYLPTLAALAILIVGLIALVATDRAMRAAAMAETQATAEGDVAILTAGLKSELDKFSLVPQVLATDPEVRALLAGDRQRQGLLNRRLADLAAQTGASAIYLMDDTGTTLAASNWNLPTSFVGSNYGFRSYFAEAMTDGSSTEFALGTVSREPGLYIAERVRAGSETLGVVTVKVEFDAIEQSWREAAEAVFVTDADGVVLLASNPAWRFRTTRPSSAGNRDPARDRLRFGVASLEALPFANAGSEPGSVALVEKVQPIATPGWDLHLLVDPAQRVSSATASGRLMVLLGLLVAGLIAGALVVLARRRAERVEAQLAERTATLRDQLLQANRLATLGQVTAGLGHEIRQPVAAMRIYAENGERLIAQGQTDAARENFAKITDLTTRIRQITEELLRFSRRGARDPRAMPLGQAIDGALLLLRDRIVRHGVEVSLPDPKLAQTLVRAEHVRLEQVLVNLLQNALDASPPDSAVAIEIILESEHCLLTVADRGAGIDETTRASLFQPFATTKEEGLGLGLVISQDIMRSLGGDLREDKAAVGARFTMVIPRA